MDATRRGLFPSANYPRFIDLDWPPTAGSLDHSRGCRRRRRSFRLWRRCFRVSGGLFEAYDLGGRNADQRADTKAAQLPLIYELADHAVAAPPALGQLCDRIWPNIVLGQDVAPFSQSVAAFSVGTLPKPAGKLPRPLDLDAGADIAPCRLSPWPLPAQLS